MFLKGLALFQDYLITSRFIPVCLPANTLQTNPCTLKKAFQQEINKMLQAGILAPVNEATPWINSFVLVESKDKLGNLKLHICLEPTNLNKVITREPYHFRTPEDIAHLLADASIMTVSDCKKGYWHQKLDKVSSFVTSLTLRLADLDIQ